VPIDVGVEVNT